MSAAILALVADEPTHQEPTSTLEATDNRTDPGHRLRVGIAPSPWPTPRPTPISLHAGDGASGQGELDLELVLSSGFGGAPKPALFRVGRTPDATAGTGLRRSTGRATRDEQDDEDDFSRRRPTPTRDLPDPMAWSARLAQAIAEIRAGFRPPQQLTRWTTRSVLDELRRSHASARDRTPTSVRVRSVHAGQPADGVVEATAIVTRGSRSRALALRLEGWDGKWVCVSADVV